MEYSTENAALVYLITVILAPFFMLLASYLMVKLGAIKLIDAPQWLKPWKAQKMKLPQGTNPTHSVPLIPTEAETEEYERDLEAQEKGFIHDYVKSRIARYEYLYTRKRDKLK